MKSEFVIQGVPDITLQGGGGAGYQGEQNYGGGGAGYQGSAGGSGDMRDGAPTWRLVKGLFVENFKHLDIGDPVIMKHKIEPKSWKEVAESLDAVDQKDVLQLYEDGREDELEAYYENAVYARLRRVMLRSDRADQRAQELRYELGHQPACEDRSAWRAIKDLESYQFWPMVWALIAFTVSVFSLWKAW